MAAARESPADTSPTQNAERFRRPEMRTGAVETRTSSALRSGGVSICKSGIKPAMVQCVFIGFAMRYAYFSL